MHPGNIHMSGCNMLSLTNCVFTAGPATGMPPSNLYGAAPLQPTAAGVQGNPSMMQPRPAYGAPPPSGPHQLASQMQQMRVGGPSPQGVPGPSQPPSRMPPASAAVRPPPAMPRPGFTPAMQNGGMNPPQQQQQQPAAGGIPPQQQQQYRPPGAIRMQPPAAPLQQQQQQYPRPNLTQFSAPLSGAAPPPRPPSLAGLNAPPPAPMTAAAPPRAPFMGQQQQQPIAGSVSRPPIPGPQIVQQQQQPQTPGYPQQPQPQQQMPRSLGAYPPQIQPPPPPAPPNAFGGPPLSSAGPPPPSMYPQQHMQQQHMQPSVPFSPTAGGSIPGTPGRWGPPPAFGTAAGAGAGPPPLGPPPHLHQGGPGGFGGLPPPPPTLQQQQQMQMQQMQQHQQGQPPPTMTMMGSATDAPQQQGAMTGKDIPPNAMPHPESIAPPTQVYETRRQNTHTVPPPTDAPIVVRDCGSAGPRYMRSSLNSIPQGADLLKSSSLPFVVMINPLALPENKDSVVDVVDAGPAVGGPLRCVDCKAYVCSYMRWVENGRKMECCFCGSSNTVVPPEYFSHIGGDGQRRDRDDRPELCRGSVEFDVGGEYLVRPPVPPTYFFLIEVTAGAIGTGATAAACASIAQLLDELPGGTRTRVGIATFDARVHFYAPKLSSSRNHNATNGAINSNGGVDSQQSPDDEASSASQQQPVMLVMSDVADPFCPIGGSAAAVNLSEHKTALKNLLDSIPKTFADSQIGGSAGGAAIKTTIDALKNGVGGRALVFLASLPHVGSFSLRPREAGRPPSERDPLDVMTPEGKHYTVLAQDAAEHQVSIDIFALTQGYVDLATLSVLCTETSGSMHRYNPFNPAADSARLHNDLRWCLVRPQGFEAVARLRASSGLVVDNYVGAFHRRNLTDLHFPALSCDHTIAARLIHEERLREGTEIYLQYALLYTNTEGRRRVRVHTLALPVTRSIGSTFRTADLDTYVTYVAKKVSVQLPGRTIAACRDVVIKAAVDTLTAYRRHVATQPSSGQLILPEGFRLLPLYCLGLTKLACFRTDARADSRATWMTRLLTASPSMVMPMLYPRLLELDTLPDRPSNAPKIPERLWLTALVLQPERIYLLENGFDAHIMIGAAVPPEICTALLGVPNPEMVDIVQFSGPPVLDNPLSKSVLALLDEIRRQRKNYLHLRLMRRGHPQEAAFMASLIEDRSPSAGMSYVEWMCMLHRQIQNKLS